MLFHLLTIGSFSHGAIAFDGEVEKMPEIKEISALDGKGQLKIDGHSIGRHMTRPLQIVVPAGGGLKAAVEHASSGDVLVLADGIHMSTSSITIGKNLTIRAQNPGRAVLDGRYQACVLSSRSSIHVVLEGLNITNGSTREVIDA